MRKGIAAALGLLCLLAGASAKAQAVQMQGRVVDGDGKPVAGATVATYWFVDEQTGEQRASHGAETDADGRFNLEVKTHGHHAALMALDGAKKRGGLAIVAPDGSKTPIEIRLQPTVRLHGKLDSRELGSQPSWSNVYVWLGPNHIRALDPGVIEKEASLRKADPMSRESPIQVAGNSSRNADFSVILPRGEYELDAYGADVRTVRKTVTLRAEQPDHDLGTIDIPATVVAMHKGKEPPAWTIADARKVKKDVTLADYRGKWVLVDFWGYWCGPCVQQLAGMIDFYEEHAADRDKFEIIAIHDGSVKDFSEMEERLAGTKKLLWQGRDLPFPVLLDAPNGERGATVKTYDIHSFPTTLLIDPQGKLVGEVGIRSLEEKLPPIPIARRIARSLDGNVVLGVEPAPLDKVVEMLAQSARLPIQIDVGSLKAAGVDPAMKIHLNLAGSLSLRSWLELVLDPFGLEARPGEKGLVIVKAAIDPARREPSKVQRASAQRIEDMLARKSPFDFKNATLDDVAQHFENETQENFVLDPIARKAKLLDPAAVVSGSDEGKPLREAIEKLLKPLGLRLIVKDEVVLITK